MSRRPKKESRPTRRVVVIGAGNIGSHLIPHLGRMPEIAEAVIIDGDRYERSNLVSQAIAARDIGRAKAVVQARRLRRINPALAVEPIVDRAERVALGRLRADAILACVDSRRSRLVISEAAWRLGVPLIDAGVDGQALLARVNVYAPGVGAACLECAWDERDYAAVETVYPCQRAAKTFASGAPSTIGALAATLQAIECRKLLSGRFDEAAIGRQILIDARHHRHFVTTIPCNPRCRFDHEVWPVKVIGGRAGSITLGEAMALGGGSAADCAQIGIEVEGSVFVRQLTCADCGFRTRMMRFERSLRASERICRECGQPAMIAGGFDLTERLDAGLLPRRALGRSLASFGLRDRDVFTLDDGGRKLHFEIGGVK